MINLLSTIEVYCIFAVKSEVNFDFDINQTDEQLVHYVEDRVEKARSEGFNCGKASVPKTGEGAKEFIAFLQLNKIPGIGAVTINKLIKVAEENGYL